MKKLTGIQRKIIKAVEKVIIARRTNVMREQMAYENLRSLCEKNNIDLLSALEQGERYLKENKLSLSLSGYL